MQNDIRRAAFVEAAAELYEQQGIANTSVGDITRRVGVTRSLFYHYFDDRQAILDAVIDDHVDGFMTYVQEWSHTLSGNNVYDALVRLAGIVRDYLFGPKSLGRCIVDEQDASVFQRFVVHSSLMLAEHFVQMRGRPGALIQLSNSRHPKESFYVLSVGVMSLMIHQSEASDEVVADLIVDTLNIDVGYRME